MIDTLSASVGDLAEVSIGIADNIASIVRGGGRTAPIQTQATLNQTAQQANRQLIILLVAGAAIWYFLRR